MKELKRHYLDIPSRSMVHRRLTGYYLSEVLASKGCVINRILIMADGTADVLIRMFNIGAFIADAKISIPPKYSMKEGSFDSKDEYTDLVLSYQWDSKNNKSICPTWHTAIGFHLTEHGAETLLFSLSFDNRDELPF